MSNLDNATMLAESGAPAGPMGDGLTHKLRLGPHRELISGLAHGRYYEAARRGNVFAAYAIVTAPVIWSTEAGTGGPLLWNGSSTVKANILGVGIAVTVVTTVAAALGFTTGSGQSSAPTTTTAIDSVGNMLPGGADPACTAYRIGTTVLNKHFVPIAHVHTGALTVDTFGFGWFDVNGMIVVPPNCFASLAASATATTLVMNACIVWEEISI